MNYYIGDLHLFNRNQTDEGRNYDGRPFATVEEMNQYILERWNAKINNGDTVYILGDMAMRGKNNALLALVAQLKGKKILFRGNHDDLSDYRYQRLFEEITDYRERNEDAITETSSKYGKLFFRIASNILLNHEDSEECVNDTYLGLWNAIPKERPSPFSVFASRITRNLALKKYEYLSAEKRKPEAICSFEELGDCVSGKEYVESEAENRRIEQLIDTFLCQIGEEKRNIFLCRYWYLLWFLLPLSYF